MAGINRKTDISMGADGCPPAFAVGTTCGNVLIEKLPPLIVGNIYGRHMGGGKHCRHTECVVSGNPKVLINGSPVLVTCNVLSHGDLAGRGSITVIVG